MTSWILIASYLWKDTWKRWFEQPGSILARLAVTTIMVALSVTLLVAFQVQVKKLRDQVASFGLDNLLIIETISPETILQGTGDNRFSHLSEWGDLLTVKKLPLSATSSEGRRVSIVTYDEANASGLHAYLAYGHDVFLLSETKPAGLVIDFTINGDQIRAVALKPDQNAAQMLQEDTLFLPNKAHSHLEEKGYSILYHLRRSQSAPDVGSIAEVVRNVVATDRKGKVDIRSAAAIKKQLDQLQSQQIKLRLAMAILLGGALTLIYGTLSVLEFRQSVYVSSLMRSFGTPVSLLALRTVIENLLIANAAALLTTWGLHSYHSPLFSTLKLNNIATSPDTLHAMYWGQETLWLFAFVNAGVLLSCLPVFTALRKPVGKVLN